MIPLICCSMVMAAFHPSVARLVQLRVGHEFPREGSKVVVVENVKAGIEFNEVIPSWNLDHPENGSVKVELRVPGDSGAKSQWFTMAEWSGDKAWAHRQSLNGQSDDFARVSTDTLRLKHKSSAVDVRITLASKGESGASRSSLKLVTLSFADTSTVAGEEPLEKSAAWGKLIDVPQRAQGNYPNGKVLCSATSTSMLLWHWSNALGKPEMNKDVPEVEENVWDPVYKGAGNWPFNTAYAGGFTELKGYVSRLTSIADLQDLIAAGIPVACSVSFDMLRGKPLSPMESGHLVLVVGFTEDGTPIFNDPAFKDGVRKIYRREDFEKGWNYSNRTVYIIHPVTLKLPSSKHKVWIN